MNEYPPVVEKIVSDYLLRLKSQLGTIPTPEHQEILQEIGSHIYESYVAETADNEVDRILLVLRKLGEPAEVLSSRVPRAMMAIGRRKNLPLYILGGAIALLFGVPLGLGGVALLVGLLAALFGLLVAYFALGTSLVVGGLLIMVLGGLLVFNPEMASKLLFMGYLNLDWGTSGLNQMPLVYQGLLVLLIGLILAAVGLGLLWLGKYLLKGLRYLLSLASQKIRQFTAQHNKKNFKMTNLLF
jgi:uncharacterized membrane protein